MIGHIAGTVLAVRDGYAVIAAGGVGYKVSIAATHLLTMKTGDAASLWTHLAVREDAMDLYGFDQEQELKLFELLLTVSGIGPRSALAIIDIAAPETFRAAIAAGNTAYLTSVSGIGKKTAEKIILELRDKVGLAAEDESAAIRGDVEALEALRALGYTPGEARDVLRRVPASLQTGSDRLREALKLLGSH